MRQWASLEERFWAKIDKTDECWLWNGTLGRSKDGRPGYGNIYGKGRVWLTHRLAWHLQVGEIPDGLNVLHTCDVRRCCRREHLFLGTHTDNMRDARSKGRSAAKLSLDDVAAIRRFKHEGLLLREIAVRFGVTEQAVRRYL